MFTSFAMRRIPEGVRAGLSEEQLLAIRKAIYESRPGQGHAIDARLNIPLFFAKFYLVFQCGRDRRSRTRNAEVRRLRTANKVVDGLVFAVLLLNALQLLFLFLYVIKSLLGINLFPHRHLIDFLPEL